MATVDAAIVIVVIGIVIVVEIAVISIDSMIIEAFVGLASVNTTDFEAEDIVIVVARAILQQQRWALEWQSIDP